jgi:2-amino-4-hydroxy-6-hydroxymethyldihydropteridine diphosphokinase
MTTRACIGLGSNLGDRRATLDAALDALRASPGITAPVSSPYRETAPIGGPPGQGPFLNAAASFETTLPPLELLRALQKIEAQSGRVRRERWGERPLDLDLLLYGPLILDSEELTLPHRWLAIRRFVLEPLVEIAPEAVDPLTGQTTRSLLENLKRRPRSVLLFGWAPTSLAAIVPAIPPDWSPRIPPNEADPRPATSPTFVAAPAFWRTERFSLAQGALAETPFLFIPERDAAQDIRAACLAAADI